METGLYIPKMDKDLSRAVRVMDVTGDSLMFCPEGGGFQYRAQQAKFLVEYKRVDDDELSALMVKRKGMFTGDWDMARAIPGYTDGTKWNGWAVPFFEKGALLEAMADDTITNLVYDEERDVFAVSAEEDMDPEEFGVQAVKTADGVKLLYAVGAWSWCWEEE